MKQKITIRQGSTFEWVIRWESLTLAFAAVTAITKAAPPVLTAAGHGMPDGWRAAFTNIGGMTELNAESDPPGDDDFYKITRLDADSFSLDGVDATGFSAYTSGGVLRYYEPIDLAGRTARMHIRETRDALTTLLELTTENGRIALDNAAKTITVTIDAVDTAALDFTTAVYDLELVGAGGEVAAILEGNVALKREVTR